jgi:hypothetical protein
MPQSERAAVLLIAGTAALAALPLLAQRAPTTGPVARYDMRAGTVSGMGAMGAGGMGSVMGAMFGGGRNKVQKELYLRLGSTTGPTAGNPKADHFMPSVAKLGKSVALATPREEREVVDEIPGERPRGRILIYWGCADKAPKGQPVVIDLARLAQGQAPPGLWTTTILRDWGPSLRNSRTFGRWPAEDNKYVKSESSLLGAHRVAGNYSPEIAFTLTKDFMPALSPQTAAQASGAALLSWNAIAEATGYHAFLFGSKQAPDGQMADMVMWSSSFAKQFGGGLSDWISPDQAARLVREKTLLAPGTTSCMIPAEVLRNAPDFRFGTLTAFGPQEDFAYPPRPADPKAAWNLQWTARIRHRSFTSWMDIAGMPGQQQGAQPQCKRSGGLLGSILGPGC